MKSIIAISTCTLMAALAPSCYGQRFTTLSTLTGDVPIGLIAGQGVLYGVSFGQGPGAVCGTFFELTPPGSPGMTWTATTLYDFVNGGGDACQPVGAPVAGVGGLYGVTSHGGVYPPPQFGAVYEFQPPTSPGGAWTESVVYSFGAPGSSIGYPLCNIVPGPMGSYYVLTADPASLTQLLPPASPGGAWTATVLYTFPIEPSLPPTSLTAGPNGVLYGTTAKGGNAPGQLGEVFQLTPPATPGGAWTLTALYSFGAPGTYVGNPNSLTVASDGTIYGTTYGWDQDGIGTGFGAAFQLTPPASPGGAWTYTNLTTPNPNRHFVTPLVLANGHLYGAYGTGREGASGGAVFELTPPAAPSGAWTMTTLHTFTDGQLPIANLLVGSHGTVYGGAGAYPAPPQPAIGTVYAITPQ
jgi:hypothetical protein